MTTNGPNGPESPESPLHSPNPLCMRPHPGGARCVKPYKHEGDLHADASGWTWTDADTRRVYDETIRRMEQGVEASGTRVIVDGKVVEGGITERPIAKVIEKTTTIYGHRITVQVADSHRGYMQPSTRPNKIRLEIDGREVLTAPADLIAELVDLLQWVERHARKEDVL